MPYAGEKVMRCSVLVLVALWPSNYLPFSQLGYFFRLLMNARVLMNSSIALARARLRACWWLRVRAASDSAGVADGGSARKRAWLCSLVGVGAKTIFSPFPTFCFPTFLFRV